MPKKEETNVIKKLFKGGTEETSLKPIDEPGQSITIHAVPEGITGWVHPETPSLALEFLN